jgi:N-methylhydantoinase B/oxoprolinase/acetone carboxylase alpha subunit
MLVSKAEFQIESQYCVIVSFGMIGGVSGEWASVEEFLERFTKMNLKLQQILVLSFGDRY